MIGRHIPLRAFVLIGLLTLSGCTSSLVLIKQEEISHPIVELGEMKQTLQGLIIGETEQNHIRYMRILLPDARQSCGSTQPLELLLPVSDDAALHAILRESSLSAGAGGESKSLAVYSGDYRHDSFKKHWDLNLPGEGDVISPLIIEPVDSYDLNKSFNVYYRLPDSPVQPRPIDIDLDIDWVCRSRLKVAGMSILYIPAFLLDVVTFPFQALMVKAMTEGF